jgi:tetratricopeptide (TPR) repeat protein
VLLERDDCLSTLGDLLAGVRSEGRLVVVGGEAGVGKTTLLRRFCEMSDARVLWGACEPLRTPPPLGPFLEAAEATGSELAALVAGSPRPHEVAAAVLDELRRRGPTVLVLEDLHWADEATLDVVSLLVPRIASAPALVLASYRDDELDRAGQLRVLLGELVRRPGRLKLAPLSPAAVAELAAPHGADADELYRRTGGNPFFVVEVLAGGGERMPDTVRDAVLARAARLSQAAGRLLEAVAVVPGAVELWLLEALAGELADHLDEAAGMLSAGPAHVAFRHELARLAIDEATPPNRRLALHRAALAALSARGGEVDLARLAHHADAAGDTEAVLRWAPQAAERAAAAGAHREAAAQYARALRYAGGLAPARRAELLAARAHECYTTADFDEAVAAQREALACHRAGGDRRGEGDAVRALSRLLFFAGRTEEGEPLALEAVALLETPPPSHELAMAYGNVTQRRAVVDDLDAAATWGARALELADRLGDTEARLYALTSLGMAELQADRPEGATRLEEVIAVAPEHGLEEFAGRAFSALVMSWLRHRRYDRARRDLEVGPGVLRRARTRYVAALPRRVAGAAGARARPLGRRGRRRRRGSARPPQPARGARVGAVRAGPPSGPPRRCPGRGAARGGARARTVDRGAHAHRAGRGRARRGGVAGRPLRGGRGPDRRGAGAGARAPRAVGDRRARVLAAAGRPARRHRPCGARGALPTRARGRRGARGGALAGARLPLRGGAGARRRDLGPRASGARRAPGGPCPRAAAARAGRARHPARTASAHAREPGGPDRPRARSSGC